MANLQSQIDILAKAVVNEHVRVSNLQTVSVSNVTSKVNSYTTDGGMIEKDGEKVVIDYNHQVYDLKDKNEIIGTFFGYNNDDKYFGGIWCHDDLNNYVIDQYGDIVTYKEGNKLVLTDDSYVRKIGLSDSEFDINQGTKNKSRMIYVGETETAEVGDESIIYNKNTLRIVNGSNNEYVNCIYLDFGNGVVFILDETSDKIKYLSNGYTASKDDNGNIMFVSKDNNYVYYKSSIIDDTYKTNLKGAIISNSTTTITTSDFYNCTSLTSVIIPNSVITIGEKAFAGCGLLRVIIPNSVTTIGDNAFALCDKLTSVIIPDSVITIGKQAFTGCDNLQTVTIGNSVTTIGKQAFSSCHNLTSIEVDKDNINYSSDKGVLFDKNKKTLIQYPPNISESEYEIPITVTTIGDSAFALCGLLRVIIPNSVTTIDDYAFQACSNLTSVTIGNSVITIGDCAFKGCTNLESVNIGNSVETIGNQAFDYIPNDCKVYVYDKSNGNQLSRNNLGEDHILVITFDNKIQNPVTEPTS